jgi:hypothetical protein
VKTFTKICVLDESYACSLDHDHHYCSRDTVVTHHDIRGFSVSTGYSDLETLLKIKDKDYFLLYVLYSTGDSFGRDEGRIDFVELYDDKELAHAAEKVIRECYLQSNRGRNHSGMVSIPMADGKKREIYIAGFNDYFGGVDDVRVETVRPI